MLSPFHWSSAPAVVDVEHCYGTAYEYCRSGTKDIMIPNQHVK